MKWQRYTQTDKQDKIPEDERSEVEIKMLKELERKLDEQSKKLEVLKNSLKM